MKPLTLSFLLFLIKLFLMLIKEKVLEALQSLPGEFSLDELVERLILLEKVEIALKQVEEGKTLSQEEAKEKMRKWQK